MYRIIIGKVAQKENVIDPALLLSVKHGIWSHLVKWIFFQFGKHSLSQIKLLNRVCTFASASYQYNQYKEAKTRKLIKIEMLRSVEKKVVVRVSAQVSNRGQNIGVARFWASGGNIASQVRGALSSHCSEGEGRRGRILACLSCHTVTGHKAPRKQLFCKITSTSSLLSWRRTIRNRNGDILAFSAPIVWSWVKQTEDWSVFLSRRHEVSGSRVTRIRRRRNNSLHFRILLFKLLPKLDIEIKSFGIWSNAVRLRGFGRKIGSFDEVCAKIASFDEAASSFARQGVSASKTFWQVLQLKIWKLSLSNVLSGCS